MTGRALGLSLIAGAVVLALLMLAWLAVSGARGGGILLGLILLVILAGPLAIGGVVVLSRLPAEERQPGLPVARLEDVAEDLERAPSVAPSALLRAGAPARGLEAIQHLGPGDAVSSDGTDYLVEGMARYFDDGQVWKLLHLAPAGAGASDRCLYVGPAGLELALLDETSPPASEDVVAYDGRDLPRVTSGKATVDVESQAGSARGVLVSFARYAAHSAMGLVERWPDGASHAYLGRCVKAMDLEVWPASDRATHTH